MIKKSNLLKRVAIGCLIGLFILIGGTGQVHAADQYVDDQAHVLKKQTVHFINKQNQDLDKGQIYVVTVRTTGRTTIKQAAAQYFARHHLGKNATMLMYAIKDRKVQFEKGSKIGEMFTNKYLGTILTSHVKEDFRDDNYDAGVQLMVSRLADTLNGEESDSSSQQSSTNDWDSIFSIFGIGGVIIFVIISAVIGLVSKDDRNDCYYDDDRYNNSSFIDSSDSDSGSDDSGDTGSW